MMWHLSSTVMSIAVTSDRSISTTMSMVGHKAAGGPLPSAQQLPNSNVNRVSSLVVPSRALFTAQSKCGNHRYAAVPEAAQSEAAGAGIQGSLL